MFSQRRSQTVRPSKAYQYARRNDQLPFLSGARFSALPHFRVVDDEPESLTLVMATLYIIDLFGVFPFVILPGLLVDLGYLGIPLVISVIALQIYTSFLLSRCWTMAEVIDPSIVQKSRYPYAAIADLAYGPNISRFVRILLDLSIFATGIPNIVIAAANLELAGQRINDGRFSISFCVWVIIVGLFLSPLMWMRSPKKMRTLAILSVCVVMIIVILLWYCLFVTRSVGPPFEGLTLGLPPFLTILNGYSVLAFQFDIHPMLLTLQIDMRKAQKSQVWIAACTGISITCIIAIVGSVVAAYKFGTMIADNLLESLPRSVPLFCLLILMALQLCFSATVGSSAMFLQIENYFKVTDGFSFKRVAIRSTVVALEVIIAEFVPDFDTLMDVVGGTITGPLVFILPPLLYRRIRNMERVHQRIIVEASYGSIPLALNYETPSEVQLLISTTTSTWKSLCFRGLHRLRCDMSTPMAVMIFGIVAAFISTYLNIFKITNLFTNNSQCFGNLTKAF